MCQPHNVAVRDVHSNSIAQKHAYRQNFFKDRLEGLPRVGAGTRKQCQDQYIDIYLLAAPLGLADATPAKTSNSI